MVGNGRELVKTSSQSAPVNAVVVLVATTLYQILPVGLSSCEVVMVDAPIFVQGPPELLVEDCT